MDISALSVGLNQIQLQQSVGLALTKKALYAAQLQSQEMVNMIQQSAVPAPHPTSGHKIDVSV
ncbi:YjfB family protein [Bacillus smithii]|uniref:YjfB family protein n=1 Tax=Bacillus smithii TaxID=1479 RepID=UPI002E24E6F2|nr:YjfB family protein [Bacillus smithii]